MEHASGETFIEVRTVLFAEVQDKMVTLHTTSGDYSIKRTSLDTLCDSIGSDCLMRCHKSFALNPGAVREIVPAERRNWLAVFQNGSECPISQTYYSKTRAAFLDKMTRKVQEKPFQGIHIVRHKWSHILCVGSIFCEVTSY